MPFDFSAGATFSSQSSGFRGIFIPSVENRRLSASAMN
jgi:hypothetical protein